MRAKHNKTLADLRLTLSIMIGALDPLFCLFPNLNEIMIAESGSIRVQGRKCLGGVASLEVAHGLHGLEVAG